MSSVSMLRPEVKLFRNPVYDDGQPPPAGVTDEQRSAERAAAFAEWQLKRPGLKRVPDSAAVSIPLTEQEIRDMFLPFSRGLLSNMGYMVFGLYALVFVNLVVEAYTDPLYQTDSSTFGPLLLACVQVVLPLGIGMGFFVLTSSTVFIRLGCYGRYLREFALLYISLLFTVLFVFAVKIYYILELYQYTESSTQWALPGYQLIWSVQQVVLLLFWLVVVYSSATVFQEKYFDAEFLITRKDPAGAGGLLGAEVVVAVPISVPAGRLVTGRQPAGDGHIEVVGITEQQPE